VKTKLLLTMALFFNAQTAMAQEVRLVADTVRSPLNDASLLRSLDDTAAPQDYIAAARADYRRLLTALYAAGYYAGSISITIDGVEASSLSPLAAPSAIGEVVITVNSGPLFTFGDVSIAPVPQGAELSAELEPGEPALSGEIRSAANAGVTAWRELGYPLARVGNQQITARHPETVLDVNVTLAPGERLRFGELDVSGNNRVRTERVVAIAGLPTGEVYSPAAIAAAEQRLRRTGAFNSASLRLADQAGPGDTIGVRAQLDEAPLRRIGFGIELSSVEGLTLSTFWLHRNLFGGAERFRVEAIVSGIEGDTGGMDYALRASFGRPATFNADTDFYVNAEISRQDEPTFLIDKFEVETGITRYVTEDLTLQAGIGLLTAREESALGNRDYTLLTLPLRATLDRRDVPTNAKSGYYLDGRLSPFTSFDGGITGARIYGDGRIYRSFGAEEGFTLAARGTVGSLVGAEIVDAPADFLYFSGGGGTVRGQPFKSLGVDIVQGMDTITTGGLSFAGAQLEARYQVRDNLYLVGFYDVGFVGDTPVPGESGNWHAGAGIGARYETGIGPIRLDIGTPASGDDAGESVQVYIGIGQAF
jgi:translocation and assembly module TamA